MADSVGEKRREVRTREMRAVLEDLLQVHQDAFDTYVRIHRALHGFDPDPCDVPIEFEDGAN